MGFTNIVVPPEIHSDFSEYVTLLCARFGVKCSKRSALCLLVKQALAAEKALAAQSQGGGR